MKTEPDKIKPILKDDPLYLRSFSAFILLILISPLIFIGMMCILGKDSWNRKKAKREKKGRKLSNTGHQKG